MTTTVAAGAAFGEPAAPVAILDGGSFVLPYDAELIRMLAGHGVPVDVYASRTRYNGELLASLATTAGASVHLADVSGSVAPRGRGALAYLRLLLRLHGRSHRYATINLQFSAAWPLELPFLLRWRRRLVFTVHNPVPHGFAGVRHRPTGWIAALARELVFVSDFSRDDFLRRYGERRFRARSRVLPHGLLPPATADRAPVPYRAPAAPPTALIFWGNVQPYKGVELFAALARSAEVRRRGLRLEVHGAWAQAMAPLRRELIGLGIDVHDRFLDAARLRALLARDALFLLPYREASQSGALYTLLHAGRVFASSDVGDVGAFHRRFALDDLLLQGRDADAVLACLDRLQAAPEAVHKAFAAAQRQSSWEAIWPAAAAVYRAPRRANRGETIRPR